MSSDGSYKEAYALAKTTEDLINAAVQKAGIATDELPEDPSCWKEYWKSGQSPVEALQDRENWV